MNAVMDARNRYPWNAEELAYLTAAKARRVNHKTIARQLNRTPRAIDQKWAVLTKHRVEELELLETVRAEARSPEKFVER